MKYTILNINGVSDISISDDIAVVGVDFTWKYYKNTKFVFFTRFDALIEFINSESKESTIPMCSTELITDANSKGRFSVIRNLIRTNRLKYCDAIGGIRAACNLLLPGYVCIDGVIGDAVPSIKKTDVFFKPEILVSVILPHYNRSEIVKKSIKSILSQTYRNIELLIVDDCSDDLHYNELVKYANELNDNRISVYRMSKNCGPYVCKNEMINVASGDYITMQDSDDISLPERIATQVKCMDDSNVVACSVSTFRANTKEEYKFCLASAMYRKHVFQDIGYFDTIRFGADSEYNARLRRYYKPNQVVSINKRLYETTFNSDCLTSIVPQNSTNRNDYYASCLTYINNTERCKLYLGYPVEKRRFYTPMDMIADISELTCKKVFGAKSNAYVSIDKNIKRSPYAAHGKTVVFNQYFGLGDILFIEPIIRQYFKNGYHVVLPVTPSLLNLQPYFPYIQFVNKDEYDIDYEEQRIIDTGNTIILPMRFSMEFLNGTLKDTMRNKYAMLGIDLEQWRTLTWMRHRYKEEELKNRLGITGEYNLVNMNFHTFKSKRREIKVNNGLRNVEMTFINGYTLLDWASIIESATTIHTVSTSILYMIETSKTSARELHIYSRNVNGDDFKQVDYLFGKKWIIHK